MSGPGTLFGVGVGPGDPELVTLKAARVLGAAPVLAYPCNHAGESQARRLAAPHLPPKVRELPIPLACDARRTPDHDAYDAAAKTIAALLREGLDVVVPCEGDPFLYGSFIHLFTRLGRDFPVSVVPGVTSVSACAAALHAPLASGNERLAVVPAPRDEAEIEALLAQADGAAVMKLGRHLPKVARVLDRLGLTGAARYIEWAGHPEQRIRPFREVAAEGSAPYFAMVLVHRRDREQSP